MQVQNQWGLQLPEVSSIIIIILIVIIIIMIRIISESRSQDAKIILETADGDKDQRLGCPEFTNQMTTMTYRPCKFLMLLKV